jgi:hypothetical protein
MTQAKVVKPQSKNNSLKIIAIVVAFIMWGATLYMNALMLSKIFYVIELEEKHYGTILRNTDVINYKITNDEESRRKLKDWYDIDYKKDQ